MNARRYITLTATLCSGAFIAALMIVVAAVVSAEPRRGDNPRPPTTWEKMPGDFEAITWAAVPVPVDGVDAVVVTSPVSERVFMANGLLGNLLSDPVWRTEISLLFYNRLKIIKVLETPTDEEREEAAAWARDLAVLVPLAFADALIEAGE